MRTIKLNNQYVTIIKNWSTTEIPITYFSYLTTYIQYWKVWNRKETIILTPEDIVYIHSRIVSKNETRNLYCRNYYHNNKS